MRDSCSESDIHRPALHCNGEGSNTARVEWVLSGAIGQKNWSDFDRSLAAVLGRHSRESATERMFDSDSELEPAYKLETDCRVGVGGCSLGPVGRSRSGRGHCVTVLVLVAGAKCPGKPDSRAAPQEGIRGGYQMSHWTLFGYCCYRADCYVGHPDESPLSHLYLTGTETRSLLLLALISQSVFPYEVASLLSGIRTVHSIHPALQQIPDRTPA